MKLTTREIILCGLFAALVSIFAQISIPLPFTTVPLTLQIFGIAITGLILGSKCAFISTLIYLILGGIGVPVFAQFSAGIGVLFGPTGGYLLAYPLMAFIIGYIKEKSNSSILTAISMIIGLAVVYALGTVMFSLVTGNTIINSLLYCVVPFVAVDLLKLVLAYIIGETVSKRLSVKYGKLWVAAEVFLFVLVGATVNIGYLGKVGVKALIVIIGALVFRMFGVFVCLLGTSLKRKERLFTMLAYTPKATVQAAIGGIPLALGFTCGDLVLTVAVLAIVLTAPLGAFAIDLSYKKLLNR